MSALMEKLEDGRMLFNDDGLRDYLTDFLCDSATDTANNPAEIDAPIMAMLACTIASRRDDMIVNMVDAYFDRNGGASIQALNIVYKVIFSMKLEKTGHFFYGTHIAKE